MQEHIGKEIYFYERAYNSSEQQLSQVIIPILNKILDEYKAFDIGAFAQETYVDLIKNGTTNIESAYRSSIEKTANKNFHPAFSNLMIGLANAVPAGKEMEKLIHHVKASMLSYNNKPSVMGELRNEPWSIGFNDIIFTRGKFEVNTDGLRKRFTTVVDSEVKAAIYQGLLDLQSAYERTREQLDALLGDSKRESIIGNDGSSAIIEVDGRAEFNRNWLRSMFQ